MAARHRHPRPDPARTRVWEIVLRGVFGLLSVVSFVNPSLDFGGHDDVPLRAEAAPAQPPGAYTTVAN